MTSSLDVCGRLASFCLTLCGSNYSLRSEVEHFLTLILMSTMDSVVMVVISFFVSIRKGQ